MPYASKAQARFMHARHPKLAKEFDAKTDFDSLPEKSKKAARHSALKKLSAGRKKPKAIPY